MYSSRLVISSAVLSLSALAVIAQQPASRIAGPIDETRLITLAGNMPPAANAANDRGPVDPALRLTDLILVLRRSTGQQAAFDAFVASQYDPASSNFHRWLAPADIAAKFGPSAADVAAVSNWLASHGLSVDAIAPDRMTLRFSGSAAQIEAAFHTALDHVSVDGESHIANMADPRIPAALGPVVLGVKALHNFLPRPQHRLGSRVTFDPGTGRWQRAVSSASATPAAGGIRPDLGISIGSGTSAYTVEDVAPYDFATIYNVLPLWNAATPIDGTGQTIAIAGTSDINLSDVASFRSIFGLPAGTPPTIVVANGVDPGVCTGSGSVCSIDDLYENSLDVEWSGAMAKGASIVLVVSGQTSAMTDTVYSSANYVVQNQTAKILSVSYGECELGLGTAGNAAYNNLWETAATEGIAVFVASGDAGSATCDQGQAQALPYPAQYGVTVSGMASTPYDTAVGGTDLNWGATASPYWNPTNNSSTGASAAGYMPEIPWNDTCTNPVVLPILQQWAVALDNAGYSAVGPTDAESACNFATQWDSAVFNGTNGQVELDGLVNTIGGGGGVSNCTTSDGTTVASCSGGYAKPSWQSGVSGIPADGKRDLPDVSFFAGNGFLGSAYLVCVSDSGACLTSTSPTTEPTAQEVGGTSVGTPSMAGVMALIDQKMGAAQGNPNAELYSIAGKQNYGNCSSETAGGSCSFHDVDTGTIAMACGTGSPDCDIKNSGDPIGVLSGYAATAGFDPASGLGSLNVANVVNAWTSTVGTTPATVTVTPLQNSVAINQALLVKVQVAGSSGTPTGNVALTGGGFDGVEALSTGSYSFSIPAGTLPAGSLTLTGSYAGDSTYAEASGTGNVTVTKLAPTVTVTPSPSTVGANAVVNVQIAVSGVSGSPAPTGTVQLSGGGFSGGSCTLASGACSITIPQNTLVNGNDTLTAAYGGDSDYVAGTGTAVEVVTALVATVSITATPSSFSTSSSTQLSGHVTGPGPAATGTATLYLASTNTTLSAEVTGGAFILTIPAFSLTGGTTSVSVSYSGDSNYLPANGTASVNVSFTPSSITVTPSANPINTNSPLILAGTISGGDRGPTGSVVITSSGGYDEPLIVDSQQFSYTIPAGVLSAGINTITAAYTGDGFYAPSKTTISETVNQFVKISPTSMTAVANADPVSAGEWLGITVTLTGSDGPPTGNVTATSSGTSLNSLNPVVNGVAMISINPGVFPLGSNTVNLSYSGDPTYLAANTSVTFNVVGATFTLQASNPAAISPGFQATVQVNAGSTSGYTGTISVACALTSQPTGAVYPPTCSNGSIIINTGTETPAMLTISTTSASAAAASLARPRAPGLVGFGGAALAFLCFLGIPARRRGWRNLLGVLVLLFVFGGLGACGGGSNGGGGGGGGSSGTTTGSYTFTVTGAGNPAVTPAPTTTFTVTVD